ncbi:MAG: hypothetical protein ABJC13_21485 [Acidobacteriota bacterium]
MKLIPYSISDRLYLLTLPIFVLSLAFSLSTGRYSMAVMSGVGIFTVFMSSYVLQDQPPQESSVSEYSEVIDKISSLGKELGQLGRFLDRERSRVAATEDTIRKLGEERARLEPLVQTNRETVDAILGAHANRAARTAWKERLIGFALGVSASLIASFIYGYFKR